jgi:hypothetical protein
MIPSIVLILFFLFALGLPLSLFCFGRRRINLALLLAPHCGLAILAIIAANTYLFNVAVANIVPPVVGLSILNVIGVIWYFSRLGQSQIASGSKLKLKSGLTYIDKNFLIPVLLLSLTCIIYSLPFILNRDLVFYAYAGTDGYAYMSIAGYQMNHGVYDAPSADIYHVYSGLIAALTEVRNGVDKPGTMAVLAFLSSLLARLPQQVFSPLMLTGVLLTFLSVFALAQSLGYSAILSGVAGFVSTVSLPVLGLSSNTYLAATITLALFPVILALAQYIWVNKRSGLGLIALYTAYFLFSPPSSIIPIAAVFLYLGYSGYQYLRREAKAIWINALVPLGLFLLINLNPLIFELYISKLFDNLGRAFSGNYSPQWIIFGEPVTFSRAPLDSVLAWNLFWHSLGIGPIMAGTTSQIDSLGYLALGLIVLTGLAYLARSAFRRDFSILFFAYFSFWLVVLIGGVGGVFRSYEILSRVTQQFVPLHGLVYLSLLPSKGSVFWTKPLRRTVLVVALVVVMIYPFKYFYDFEKTSLFDDPQRVNQYSADSLSARGDIERIVAQSPVLFNSSIPTYTGVANAAALFSNIRLAIPPAYLKFFFLDRVPRPDDYYCAPFVLTSEMYVDIYDNVDEEILYQKNGFRLSTNNLTLFFDNVTFEIKNGFDVKVLKKLSYVQARKLIGDTIIHVCSEEARMARLTFRYTSVPDEQVFDLLVNSSPIGGMVVFGKEGMLTTMPFPLSKGVNQIELRSRSSGERVEILGISMGIER